ncbi:hypothetical protein BO78DRAFT_95305 [Aspergillus sclerotiicarbonarius CBS 121057]|uniref:Uncharacterized protein n=1 Tax=Aspergillus sclerotiicarbonarius (strain CBS 121057 / IBT 28362) TaxID=1448318 RepID=A0A319EYA7_ASPSB|nr:hypothetical protein BO78DRAFT_95305 [Aspergillus sclerotiicarbonarius CBS 121057]
MTALPGLPNKGKVVRSGFFALKMAPLFLPSAPPFTCPLGCPNNQRWLWVGAAMADCSLETTGSFSPLFHL